MYVGFDHVGSLFVINNNIVVVPRIRIKNKILIRKQK